MKKKQLWKHNENEGKEKELHTHYNVRPACLIFHIDKIVY